MSRVLAHMTMSLDGFIAAGDDRVGPLFDWYDAGPIELPSANPRIRFHLDEAGVAMMRSLLEDVGAVVCGRRLFDVANGWDDRHPIGAPVVVVTHAAPSNAGEWPTTRFEHDLRSALRTAEALAGDRDVVIASADIAGQALSLGLLDEIAVSLAPVVMGSGKAFFASLTTGPVMLDDPDVIVGTRATHLRYRVRREVA